MYVFVTYVKKKGEVSQSGYTYKEKERYESVYVSHFKFNFKWGEFSDLRLPLVSTTCV